MKNWRKIVAFIPYFFLLVAGYFVHKQLQEASFDNFRETLWQWHLYKYELALLFTLLNFIVLSGYDFWGLKIVGYPLRYLKVFRTSFLSFSISNIVGHSILSGTSIRLREYSKEKVPLSKITEVAVLNTVTFWSGFFFLTGICLLLFPVEAEMLKIPALAVKALGILFLVIIACYLVLSTRFAERDMVFWKFQIRLHGFFGGMRTILISSLDLLLCSLIFYILLPASVQIDFWHFLIIYLLAHLLGLMSGVPGGLGVVDGLLLAILTPLSSAHEILVTIFLYRVIYYLIPLIVTLIIFLWEGWADLQQVTAKGLRQTHLALAPVVPHILAIFSFCAGSVLILSGFTPGLEERLAFLEKYIPIFILELAHLSNAVAGLALMFLARELWRKNHSAYRLVFFILGLGIVFSLLKGLDWEESLVLLFVMLALVPFKKSFYRLSPLFADKTVSRFDVAAIVILFATGLWGFFSYNKVPYEHELWYQFDISGQASRFLRSLGLISFLSALYVIARYLRGPDIKEAQASPEDMAAVLKILQNVNDTDAQLVLLGDKRIRLSADKKAFLMFAEESSSWIVLGDIYGDPDSADDLLDNFLEEADRLSRTIVFYQAREKFISKLMTSGLQALKIGEEAHIPLKEFSLEGHNKKELRNACRRGEKEGVRFEFWPAEKVKLRMSEFRELSDAWLKTKNVKEKGFSLGVFSPEYLQHFSFAVALKGEQIVAFSNLWIGCKEELSVDLMRFYPGKAPPGVMDFLLVHILLWGKEQGFAYFNLGMVPLSGIAARPWSPLWYKLANFAFHHGEHFYNFKGLREYKEKFEPVWRSRFIAFDGSSSFARASRDVALLIGGGWRGVLGFKG